MLVLPAASVCVRNLTTVPHAETMVNELASEQCIAGDNASAVHRHFHHMQKMFCLWTALLSSNIASQAEQERLYMLEPANEANLMCHAKFTIRQSLRVYEIQVFRDDVKQLDMIL